MPWQESSKAIILLNCYKYRVQVLKSGLFEVMSQPPFPGAYKTKETQDLETMKEAFHMTYGREPISIMRFLDYLADVVRGMGGGGNHGHGEERGQGGYGCDSD